MVAAQKPPRDNPGPGVDARGDPVVDPTQNVLDLVEAAIKRQDDLRELQTRYTHQIGEMRETHAQYVAEMRATYQKELREAETARINAIREVDVSAAQILANQVSASAEALRAQVEAARQQTAVALDAALDPIKKDIQDLRRSQFEAQGRQGQVVETRDVQGATRLNYGAIFGGVSVFLILIFGIVTILISLRGK
jgi:hypothetical protein